MWLCYRLAWYGIQSRFRLLQAGLALTGDDAGEIMILDNGPNSTQLLHKLLDAGAFRAVFSGGRADFSNRSIAHSM